MNKILLILLMFFVTTVFGQEYSLKEIQRAAVRVRAARGSGSGTVINHSDGKYWILSNDHVTVGSNNCTVEFFHEGIKSKALPGQIVAKRRSQAMQYDMSLITVDDSLFGTNPDDHPIVIPLAPRDTVLSQGDYIYGSGCPQAKWLYAWQSRVSSVNQVLLFNREPIGGESGSGILSTINGNTNLVGILTWGINGQGAGVSLEHIHRAFNGEVAYSEDFGEIPDNVKLLAFPEESFKHMHVKGSDGKTYNARAYESGRRVGLDMPSGVLPVEWMQCPGGNCPQNPGGDDGGIFGGILRPNNPSNPPQQGGSGAWPTKPPIGSAGGTTTKPVEVKPDPKIKELEDKIAALQAELDSLKPTNAKLEDEVAKALSDLNKVKDEKESIFVQKTEVESKLKELEGVEVQNKALLDEKKSLLDELKNLVAQSSLKDAALKTLEDKLGITEKDLEQAKKDLTENSVPNITVYIQQFMNGELTTGQLVLLLGGGFICYFLGKKFGTSTVANIAIGLARTVGRKAIKDKILPHLRNRDEDEDETEDPKKKVSQSQR